MKRKILSIVIGLAILGISSIANAALTTIGTAQFGGTGSEYNLIYEDDNNGQGLLWLDYTNSTKEDWDNRMAWAQGLNTDVTLTLSFNPGIVFTAEGLWRLPSAGVNQQEGYSQTTSELGHLYYESLGGSLGDTNPFQNIQTWRYWTSTKYSDTSPWYFGFDHGYQSWESVSVEKYAMAVLPENVAVPIPSALWLLGSGLIGIFGIRRNLQK